MPRKKILIRLVQHRNSVNDKLPLSLWDGWKNYHFITSKLFTNIFNLSYTDSAQYISWNQRETIKQNLKNNLEDIYNGTNKDIEIKGDWPQELPLTAEPPKIW